MQSEQGNSCSSANNNNNNNLQQQLITTKTTPISIIDGDSSRGHKRRPSIGKSMPITALFLNLPPPSNCKNYNTLSSDGLSPDKADIEPPKYFQIKEENVKKENDLLYKSDHSKSDLDGESCHSSHNNNNNNFTMKILTKTTASNAVHKNNESEDHHCLIENEDHCANNNRKLCSICLVDKCNNTNRQNSMTPLNELCSKLCVNSECAEKILSSKITISKEDRNSSNIDEVDFLCPPTIITPTSNIDPEGSLEFISNGAMIMKPKVCSKIDEQRRKFLTDILSKVDDSNNHNEEEEEEEEKEEDPSPEDVDNVDIVGENDNSDDQEIPDIISGINNYNNVDKTESYGYSKIPKNPEEFRKKFAIVEALAKTTMMTSPAAKRRLAARRIELEREHHNSTPIGSDDEEFQPPRELLLYLVRMGSFNSAPKIQNSDSQDDSLEIPHGLTITDLLQHCKIMRGEHLPQLIQRFFLKPSLENVIFNEITEGLRVLKLNSVSKVCSEPISSPKHLRILQWNILSQTLGQNNDGFVQCPDEALTWDNRKYLIVEEILKNNPDIVCLQEVDHFKFLERVLGSQNYCGIFFPKPDSPCLYIEENNGPDGCAVFYKRDKFELINSYTRILEVWTVQSNQVAIVTNLRVMETGKEISICTTHLKARNGALLSKLRNEQGKDLLRFLNDVTDGRPTILCGDFNAEPIEPVYSTILNHKKFSFASAYAEIAAKEKLQENGNGNVCSQQDHSTITTTTTNGNNNEDNLNNDYVRTSAEISANNEPPYTTWKIREEGEVCHTIDYVFYSKKGLKVLNCLSFPQDHEIGESRTPSFQYPSDHFSLVCDFEILDNN